MRFLLEIIIIGALIYIGWEKPFTQWIHGPPPVVAPRPRPIVQAAATPSGAWMRDPNRQSSLDTPAANLIIPNIRSLLPVLGCGIQIIDHHWIHQTRIRLRINGPFFSD